MNTIDEITEALDISPERKPPENPGNINEEIPFTPLILMEIADIRAAVEAILLFLKITDRMSEAQYRFTFSHVKSTQIREGEELMTF